MRPILGTVLAIILFGCPAFAQEFGRPLQEPIEGPSAHPWTLESSINFISGDYGTGGTARTVYVPFTIQRNFSQGRMYLTVPYINQRNAVDVVDISGRPFDIPRSGVHGGQNSGLGDIIWGGSYDLLQEPYKPLSLSPFAAVKFPTADDNKGLGTGAFDETLGVAARKIFNQWSVMGRLGLVFLGNPSGIDLNDQFFYALGVGYQWNPETFSSLFYEEWAKIVDGQPDARDIVLGADYKVTDTATIFGNLGFGVSAASPDIFITMGLRIDF